MPSFFTELRRRNVFKVGAAYAIVAWLLVQVVDVVLPALQMPEWTISFVTVLLIIGFPITLIMAWAYEITPEGIKADADVPRDSITHVTGRKLDFVIIGLLVLAVGYMFVDDYLPQSGPFAGAEIDPASLEVELDEPPSIAAEPIPAIAEEEQREVLPNSVAVLLCANLSPDPDDAYFAASIHEEILNQLFKIRALSVIARTSVLQYADAPPPISQIAEELNVGAVMECTVRYAGNSILVTAQLIDPETNIHLWSDTYPGDLSDLSTIFAMQADIAMSIANAVGAEFSLEEQERIEAIPTDSPEAYALFLQARSETDPSAAQRLLDQSIAFDPNFASAYALKAVRYGRGLASSMAFAAAEDRVELNVLIRENAGKALELDSNEGRAYLALAEQEMFHWRWAEAQKLFERAYQLLPNDVLVLNRYADFSRYAGESERAISLAERAVELQPNSSMNYAALGDAYLSTGNIDAAVAQRRRVVELEAASAYAHLQLASAEALRGNDAIVFQEVQTAEQLLRGINPTTTALAYLAYVYSLIERNEDAERIVGRIEEMATSGTVVGAGAWVRAYVAVGKYDEALDWLGTIVEKVENNEPDAGFFNVIGFKDNTHSDPILDEPRFQELFSRIGPAG